MSSRRSSHRIRARVALPLLAIVVVLASIAFVLVRQATSRATTARAGAGAPHPVSTSRAVESFPAPIALIGGEAADGGERAGQATLRGRVVSGADGSGIEGAEVSMMQAGIALTSRTDVTGAFSITTAREEVVVLARVQREGFAPFAPDEARGGTQWRPQRGSAIDDVVFTLQPATSVTVSVLDARGQPVAGAELTVWDGDARDEGASITTDARGEAHIFVTPWVPIRARHAGHPPAHARITDEVLRAGRIALRFGATTEARGRVVARIVDDRQRPVAEARVSLEAVAAEPVDARFLAYAVSEGDGRVVFDTPREGRFTIGVDAAGYARATVADVAPSEREVLVKLAAGGLLRGRVRSPAGGLASFSVIVWERGGDLVLRPRAHASFLSEAGEFTLGGLEPGAYVAGAVASGLAPSERVPFTIGRAGSEATVALELRRGARVTGRVTSDRGGGIPRARVAVESFVGEGASAAQTATTRDDGTFELVGMTPGLSSLRVSADGHHPRIVSGIAPREGEDVGPIEVGLRALRENETPKTELVGIGCVLQGKDNALYVVRLVEGGAAIGAGIAVGDQIVAVDGKPATELGLDGTIQAIRGVEGTDVALDVRTGGAARHVVVRRSRVITP